jgi:uncharacterized membrane protein
MSTENMSLWEKLEAANIVSGPAPSQGDGVSPWYVKLMLGLAGWLASAFLYAFVYRMTKSLGLDWNETWLLTLLGGAMIAVAYGLMLQKRREFLTHFAIATSLAGQYMVVKAIFGYIDGDEALTWLLIAVVEVLLVGLMPNYIHRVLSAFFCTIAIVLCLSTFGDMLVVPVLLAGLAALWLHEFSSPQYMQIIRPAGYGMVMALIPCAVILDFGSASELIRMGGARSIWVSSWVGEMMTGAVALAVTCVLLRRYDVAPLGRVSLMALGATLVLSALSVQIPGITLGLVIVLLGFYGANRVLLGLGTASMLFFISSYYYQLDMTLLVKSGILLALGAILLGGRWLLPLLLPQNEEADHA